MPAMPALPANVALGATLHARRIGHELGGRPVLHDVSLSVAPSTCLGVVGPNGVGKSTLLQILAGLITPTEGQVLLDPPSATVGYLNQEHTPHRGETVRDMLLRRTGLAEAEAELAAAASLLGSEQKGSDDRYATALTRYESLAAGDFEARLITTLEQVGLHASSAELSTSALSGGQRARAALAAVLLARFDITLLDEPTNDLDFDGLGRLEETVARRRGGLVLVSHDRAFLDASVTDVIELHLHSRSGHVHGGGWSGYQAERAAERLHAEESYALYQTQRAQLRSRAQRERQWATTGVNRERRQPRDNDKAQRDFRINRTEKLAARARRSERALETMEVVEKPWEGWDLRFTINEAARSGAVVARLEDVVVTRGDFTLGPLTLDIGWADRVALVGANGSGKTTLVEALLGRLPLTAGSRRLGSSVVVGELAQDRRVLHDAPTLVASFEAATGLTTGPARSQLAKFGLDAHAATRPPSTLSPGERTRAELAAFAARGVNFLVLDEPTNHLDLPAIEQLEEALREYRGTLLLVSHDRRLLEAVELTRHVLLPHRDQAFRGLVEQR
jgi:ATPase subunit of ABC transporter with duplicated ATPase domains